MTDPSADSIQPPISGGKPADATADEPPAPASPPPSDDGGDKFAVLPHERIARLSAALPLRRDAEHVRHCLAEAFVEHADDLWPAGDPLATRAWIAAHVDELLATIERPYSVALNDYPASEEFLDRMCWLPALLSQLATAHGQNDT